MFVCMYVSVCINLPSPLTLQAVGRSGHKTVPRRSKRMPKGERAAVEVGLGHVDVTHFGGAVEEFLCDCVCVCVCLCVCVCVCVCVDM